MKSFTAKAVLTLLILFAVQGGLTFANPIYFDFASQIQTPAGYGGLTPVSSTTTGSALIEGEYVGHYGTSHTAAPASINAATLLWQVAPDPSSDAINGTPSAFNTQPFKLALTLTDVASHAQGTFNFQGTFNSDGTNPQGTLSFASSIQTQVLGHNSYTVDLSHQTSWTIPYDQMWMMMAAYGGEYDIPAQITAQPLPVQPAPEPTSLTLAALGLVTILGSGLHQGRSRTE